MNNLTQKVSAKIYRWLAAFALVAFCGFNSNGQVTVNPGAGSYATLNAAFAAINAGTHTGAITITITGNTTEPAVSVPLLKSGAPSSYTSISIKPSGGNWTINSAAAPTASRGVIELYGADNVTIDGDDPGTSGTRNLSFVVAPVTTTGVAAIRLASTSTTGTDGADNNTVKNCIITGSRPTAVSTTTNYGINMSNSSAISTGAYSSLNTVIENNLITRCYQGIFANGASATYPNTGTIIRNNTLGSSVGTDNIGGKAITVSYTATTAGATSAIIEGNDMRVGDVSPSGTGYTASIGGIEVGTVNSGLKIRKNNIHDVYQPSTSGYGAYGINISGAANCDNIEIYNNYIVNIVGIKYTTGVASTFVAYGIRYAAGATLQKINYNTIVMPNTLVGSVANYVNYGIYTVSTATISEFRNNIIVNQNVGTGTMGFYAAATTNISAGTVNYNDYYVPSGNVGFYNAASQATLANWQTATAKDANSISVLPGFISGTDFHINVASTSVNALGTPVAGITTDFDGNTRDASTPDIGADEYSPLVCTGAAGGTIAPATASRCDGQTYAMSTTGSEVGGGVTYQWQVSTTSGSGYVNVTGGSGANTTSYTTGALTPGVYYYVLQVNCSNGPVTGYSNELTLTVNGLPTVTVSPTSASRCTADPATILTAGGASTYTWSPTLGLSPTTGSPVSATPGTNTVYTVTGTDGNGCTSTAASTITVTESPQNVTATATPATICTGGSSTLTAYAGISGGVANVGTATTTIGGNNGNPYRSGNGVNNQIKTQMLYTAAELSAAGMTAGQIFGLGFTCTSSTGTIINFEVRIGHSSATLLTTTFETSPTTLVFTQASFTPVAGINMHTFNQGTFSWDGVSNILVQTCQTNSVLGTSTVSAYTPATTSNLSMQTSLTSCSSLTGTTVATKPIIRFAVLTPLSSANFTWMPGSLIGYPQIVSPAGTQIYTVTADNGGCTAQATATVTIDPLSCSAATVSSPRCANTNFTVTANTTGGGAPFNYVWSDGVGGVYPNAATITANLPAGTYNFTCAVSDACGSNCNSDILSVVVDPAPGGTASGPATGETYQNLAFSLTGYTIGSTFQWQVSTTGCGGAFSNIGGATSDLLNATANGATTYYIRCFVTGANGCTTTSNCVTTVVTAAGDNVCSANTLNVGFNGPYTNVGATAEAGEVTPPGTGCNTQTGWCGTGYQINSVWFTFTPPTTGSYSFRLNPNNNLWDSEFALYSASACGDLLTGAATLIAANDDSSGSPYQSYITPVCLTGGTTYYFMVDGYNTTTNNNWGILVIQNTSVAVSINSTTNATCFGVADGAVDVTVSTTGGSPTVAWSGAEFGVIVEPKNPSHPYYGTGSGNGFNIDGIQGKELTLVRGVTYTFNINNPGHPLYISTDAVGAGAGEVLTGVTGSQTDFGTLTFTPDGTHPALLYYQCYNHANMGWEINIVDPPLNNDLATLHAGTYTITVTDANGCTATATTTVTEPAANTYYYDADLDTYGDASETALGGCVAPAGYVSNSTDCNDGDNTINPGASEICGNAIDENCDGLAETVAPAQPSVISGAPADVCPPATGINLSVTNDPNATSYTWYTGPGTTGVTFNPVSTTNSQTIDIGASANSTYGIRVTASNACGTSAYRSISIRRATSTPAAVSGPTTVCALGTYGYSTGAVTGATSYVWSGPAGTLFDGSNPTPYTTASNSVTATLPAGFTTGTIGVAAQVACFTSTVKTLAISSTPAVIGIMTGATVVCPNTAYIYSVPLNAAVATYNWTLPVGASGSSTTNSITVTYGATVASSNICVTGTSLCGSTTAARCITTGPGIPARPASITGPSNGLCNQTVSYTCPVVAGASSYTWSSSAGGTINSGQGTNGINITFPTFTNTPAKTVCVVSNNACGTSVPRCITINGAPNTAAGITANPTSWCANATGIVFTANLTGVTGSYTLNWTYPGASVATYVSGGGNNTTLTLDWLTGSGNVAVTTSNACGNGTRTVAFASTCREGEETIAPLSDALHVYPNPTTGNINIEFSTLAKGNATVTVMDVAGRTVVSQNITTVEGANNTQLDLSTVAKGIYMLNVNTTEGNKKIKIVVE